MARFIPMHSFLSPGMDLEEIREHILLWIEDKDDNEFLEWEETYDFFDSCSDEELVSFLQNDYKMCFKPYTTYILTGDKQDECSSIV